MDMKRAALLKKHVQDAGQFCEITAEDLVALVDSTKYDDLGCKTCADAFRPRKAGQRVPHANVNILTEHVKAMLDRIHLPTSGNAGGSDKGDKK